MTDIPKYDGPRMVPLLDGTLVFNDSAEWRHLCEARDIAAWPQHDRDAWLLEIARVRGADAAGHLRKTIDEVISVAAERAR